MNSENRKIIDCMVGSCSLEGKIPSEEAVLLCEKVVAGELTTEEAIAIYKTHI